eukprot:3878638-Pyramimonas_sp.AAC.1
MGQHLDEAVDEGEHRHRVGVSSGDSQQIYVAVLHVRVCHSVVLPDGSQLALRVHQLESDWSS